MRLEDYHVVVADWAFEVVADGRSRNDVVVLEHAVDGQLCLVYSSTLPIGLPELGELAAKHDAACARAR